MANRLDIGEVVAAQMQQIVQSEEHKRVFFKGASEKCCSCSTCGKDCSCKKCGKDCKGCADHGHVHDSNCTHDKTANAVNEMIDLLQKISSVQDELGLVNSSIFTMKALAMMVMELKKTAQDDTNDVSFEQLIENMDPESRREFRASEFDDPDIVALLKQRVQESDEGREPAPFDFEAGVSADSASLIPSSIPPSEFGKDVVIPQLPELPNVGRRFMAPAKLKSPKLELEDLPSPEAVNIKTMPIRRVNKDGDLLGESKEAFRRLNDMMKKYAEGDDFEEEDDDDAELAELMRHVPGGGRQMRGHELEEMLFDEQDPDRELFDVPQDADDNYASDLDEELENGNFLESPDEDGGPGFNYRGPGELYDDTSMQKFRDPHDVVRIGPGEWKRFDELSPKERLELEMGAGLHEQLDMNPDMLPDEEVYPEAYEFDDNEDLMRSQISDNTSHDPGDDEYDYRQSRLWGSDE